MRDHVFVYTIELKPYKIFAFYKRENILTSVSNLQHPRPPDVSQIWDNANSYTQNPKRKLIESIVLPTWGVREKDLKRCAESNAIGIVESIFKDSAFDDHNLFVVIKPAYDDLYQMGMCARNAIGEIRNYELENHISKHLKLRAFW